VRRKGPSVSTRAAWDKQVSNRPCGPGTPGIAAMPRDRPRRYETGRTAAGRNRQTEFLLTALPSPYWLIIPASYKPGLPITSLTSSEPPTTPLGPAHAFRGSGLHFRQVLERTAYPPDTKLTNSKRVLQPPPNTNA